MADELTLYTHPMSRGRIARWMMEEAGVPYRTEIVDYGRAMKGSAFKAINPMGKVPALKHGQTIVTEAAAICAYMADAFPQAGLAPAHTSADRAPYYRWMFFAAGPLEQAATAKAMGWQVPEGRAGTVGFGSLDTVLDALEAALEHDYIAGKQFSAADVYVGSHIGWGMQFGTIDKRPVFVRYWEKLSARPAKQKADAIDNALVAQHPAPGAS